MWLFRVVTQSKFRCSGAHNLRPSNCGCPEHLIIIVVIFLMSVSDSRLSYDLFYYYFYHFFLHDKIINYLILKMHTTFAGSLCPGKYLTFSCVSLIISVSFLPSIISSYTHMVTVSSKFGNRAALRPTIFAIAEPLQTIYTLMCTESVCKGIFYRTAQT